MEADRYILGRLGVMEAMDIPFLDAFPLSEANELVWRLGLARIELAGTAVSLSRVSAALRAEAAGIGLEICRQGVDGIRELFDRMLDTRTKRHIGGPSFVYGSLYAWLITAHEHVDGIKSHSSLLRTMLIEHAMSEVGMMNEDKLFGEDASNSRYVTVRAAANRSGLNQKAFVARATALGLFSERDRRLHRFERASLATLATSRMGSILLKDLGPRLGISESLAAKLVRAGVIPIEEALSYGRNIFVSEQVLDDLWRRCGMDRPVVGTLNAGSTTISSRRIDTVKALRLICEGVLDTSGPMRSGDLLSLVVDLAAAEALGVRIGRDGRQSVHSPVGVFGDGTRERYSHRGEVLGTMVELLSGGTLQAVRRVRRDLKVRAAVLTALVKAGLLTTGTTSCGTRSGIETESLDEFRRRYIVSTALRVEYGVGWDATLRNRMLMMGSRITELGADHRAVVLERADVLSALQAVIDAKQRLRRGV